MGLLGNAQPRQTSGGLLNSYMPMFQAASARTGIPVQMLMAQAMQESGGNPNAVGRAGEVGLMQIMPSTAKAPGYGVNPVDVASLSDPETNINFAADYLAGRGKSAGVKDWNDPAQMALALKNYNGGGDPNYVNNVYQHLPKFAGGEASSDMLGGEGNDPFSRAKAAGMPDWYNGSPESYLKNASATPQKASGGGNSFLGGLGQFFGDNSDMLMGIGLGLLSGQSTAEAWSNAYRGMNEGADRDMRRKQMGREQSAAESIAKQYPEFADMIRANPELARSIVASKINTNYSLTPIYATNEKGETLPFQMGSNGTLREVKLPPGASLASGIEKIDAGTNWVIKDKRTGQTIAIEPKDLAGAESQKVIGKAQGESRVNASEDIAMAEKFLADIDAVAKELPDTWAIGATSLTGSIPGTQAYGFAKRVDQLKGQAFLEAFQKLRGGGAITETEGQKATDAIARLDRAQRREDFMQALGDLKGIVQNGLARVKSKAGGASYPSQALPQPNSAQPQLQPGQTFKDPSGITIQRMD